MMQSCLCGMKAVPVVEHQRLDHAFGSLLLINCKRVQHTSLPFVILAVGKMSTSKLLVSYVTV